MVDINIIPRVRTEVEKIEYPISKCGDNWWMEVRIRSPYKGTDLAFRTLPPLGDPAQVKSCDADFLEEVSGDIFRVENFVSTYSGHITDRAHGNIELMLDRAAQYVSCANTIQSTWARGFSSTRFGQIPPWPLAGQPKGSVDGNIEEGHARDCDKWRRFVKAALRNIRCAEEVAKKATIRARNKQKHIARKGRLYGQPGFGGAPQPEPDPDPQKAAILDIDQSAILDMDQADVVEQVDVYPLPPEPEPLDDELETGEIDLEEEILDDDTEVDVESGYEQDVPQDKSDTHPKRSAKKKDNTALIAGVATLGILMMTKK